MDTVVFRAEAVDPEGDPLKYDWIVRDEQGNTLIDKAKTEENSLSWEKPPAGAYTLLVIVTDYHPGGGGVIWKEMHFAVSQGPAPEPKPTYSIITGSEGEEEPLAFVREILFNGKTLLLDNTPLWNGARITTGPGVEIVLRSSTATGERLIYLSPGTQYELKELKKQTGLRALYTQLYWGVVSFYTPSGLIPIEAEEELRVLTDRVVVVIKGTQLTIEHTAGVTTVTVTEGEVEVTDKATDAVTTIRVGQTARFDGTSTPPPPGAQTIEQALDANGNGALDDAEIRQAVQYWILGQTVPGTNQTIDDVKIRQLIQMWILGTPVSADVAG